MIPSSNLRRPRKKTFEYEEKTYDTYDPLELSDMPEIFARAGAGHQSQDQQSSSSTTAPQSSEKYVFSEFDVAYNASFSSRALPKDLPDHALDGVNLCHHIWQDMVVCQLYKRYDKLCQNQIADFLKCRFRRDKAVALRALQYETWAVRTQEDDSQTQSRIADINSSLTQTEQELAEAFASKDVCKQRALENDVAFLSQRLVWIDKARQMRQNSSFQDKSSQSQQEKE